MGQIKHAAKNHLFYNLLSGAATNLDRFVKAFSTQISESRLREYREALPPEWVKDAAAVDEILGYIGKVRDNASAAANLIIGVLQ